MSTFSIMRILPPTSAGKPKQLQLDDTTWDMDAFFLAGAKAAQENTPWSANPHRSGSMRHEQWGQGHELQLAGLIDRAERATSEEAEQPLAGERPRGA